MKKSNYDTRLVERPCARCPFVVSARTYDKATDSLKDHLIATHLSVLRQAPKEAPKSSNSL